MVYDAANRRTLLFGGSSSDTAAFTSDLWAYDGQGWTFLDAGVRPPPRQGFAAAYDSTRGGLLMFGGLVGASTYPTDLWLYQGGAWSAVDAGGPQGRNYAGMTFDPVRDVFVLRSGYRGSTYFRDLWEYSAASGWTQRTLSPVPPPSYGDQLSYDTRRNLVIGLAALPAAFIWDGGAYSTFTLDAGRPWWGHAQAYDESTGKLWAVGGVDLGFSLGPSACVWDGVACAPTADEPSPVYVSAMVYDPTLERLFLYGGFGADGGCNAETWIR